MNPHHADPVRPLRALSWKYARPAAADFARVPQKSQNG